MGEIGSAVDFVVVVLVGLLSQILPGAPLRYESSQIHIQLHSKQLHEKFYEFEPEVKHIYHIFSFFNIKLNKTSLVCALPSSYSISCQFKRPPYTKCGRW